MIVIGVAVVATAVNLPLAGCSSANPTSGAPGPATQTGDATAMATQATSPTSTLPTATLPTATLAAEETPAAGIDEAALANLTYTVEDGAYTLVDGHYREAPPGSATAIVDVTLETWAVGDLNADGVQDAAVVLVNSPGGSGVFKYLEAVVASGGALENSASIPLGDRVKIDGLSIADDGAVVLDVVTHGPTDPMCCPTQAATWTYRLEGAQWVGGPDSASDGTSAP
jgi:hypothetical protein